MRVWDLAFGHQHLAVPKLCISTASGQKPTPVSTNAHTATPLAEYVSVLTVCVCVQHQAKLAHTLPSTCKLLGDWHIMLSHTQVAQHPCRGARRKDLFVVANSEG